MADILLVEWLKLKRSLVLLLCAAAPLFVAAMSLLMLLDSDRTGPWARFLMGGQGMWAYFMLPMTVTALTVLMAQMEHGPKTWNQILALPVPRWRIFAAKTVVVLALVGVMSLALFTLLYAAGWLGEQLKPGRQLTGGLHVAESARTLLSMFAGSLLMVGLQLWVALRFRSFVPPLALGIGGTFAAVAATSAELGIYFPWLIPVNALAANPGRSEEALAVGVGGGALVLLAMLIHMSRYEPT